MKLNIIEKEKDYAEFLMEGERHSFPNLLKQKLLESKDVEFASYLLEHPMDENAKFAVKTNGKAPKTVIEAALKEIESDLSDFQKQVSKALK